MLIDFIKRDNLGVIWNEDSVDASKCAYAIWRARDRKEYKRGEDALAANNLLYLLPSDIDRGRMEVHACNEYKEIMVVDTDEVMEYTLPIKRTLVVDRPVYLGLWRLIGSDIDGPVPMLLRPHYQPEVDLAIDRIVQLWDIWEDLSWERLSISGEAIQHEIEMAVQKALNKRFLDPLSGSLSTWATHYIPETGKALKELSKGNMVTVLEPLAPRGNSYGHKAHWF